MSSRKSIFSGCPGSEISIRQGDCEHEGRIEIDTTKVLPAATVLADVCKTFEPPDELSVIT
jgi:hypothetical protein